MALYQLSKLGEYATLATAPVASAIDAALLADQQYHLPAGLLMKSDAMTMAHGLEARVPLLDRRIIEFAGRCHRSLSLGMVGDSKRVLRSALATYGMPQSISGAPKRGFNAPLARMLRTSLQTHASDVFVTNVDAMSPDVRPYECIRRDAPRW